MSVISLSHEHSMCVLDLRPICSSTPCRDPAFFGLSSLTYWKLACSHGCRCSENKAKMGHSWCIIRGIYFLDGEKPYKTGNCILIPGTSLIFIFWMIALAIFSESIATSPFNLSKCIPIAKTRFFFSFHKWDLLKSSDHQLSILKSYYIKY